MQDTVESTAQLVRSAAQGDEAAWASLVDRFAGLVWSVIRGYRLTAADAADVSQTTWLRLAEHIHSLRDPERAGAWLARTAGRECLRIKQVDALHRRVDRLASWDGTDAGWGEGGSEPETALLRSEQHAQLWGAFNALDPSAQLLLRLLFADPPMSYRDIAALTGMRCGSVGPTRGRCLSHLREHLESPLPGPTTTPVGD